MNQLDRFAKVLFLDFDGVLHPTMGSPFFVKTSLLAKAIEQASVSIVISSSWRFHYRQDELIEKLGPVVGSRVIDVTGDPYIGSFARYEEILRWVNTHHCTNWKALDDSRYEFPADCPNLVLCDAQHGLTLDTLNQLTDWLGDANYYR